MPYIFKDLNDPILWSESYSSQFLIAHCQPKQRQTLTEHTTEELVELILGCYEQIPNKNEILEAIIANTNSSQTIVISRLQQQFNTYIRACQNRSQAYERKLAFMKKLYSPFSVLPPQRYNPDEIPTFRYLHTAIETCLSLLKGEDQDTSVLEMVTNFFKVATPASCFPPPTHEFLSLPQSQTEIFTSRYAHCHGTTTNGAFLFVLCADNLLHIFSISNGGSLSPPITRLLDIDIVSHPSLYATTNVLQIFTSPNVYSYTISSLLNESIPIPTVSKPKHLSNCMCLIGDGITTVQIDRGFELTVFDVNGKRRQVRLKPGNAPLHPSISVLLPTTDYQIVLMLTNGSFLAIILKIDVSTSLLRVFSLDTGCHVHDELFQHGESMFTCVLDSFNSCIWSAILLENGRLCVKKFYFAGSINPAFFEFVEPPKLSDNHPIASFVCSLYPTLLHTAGSQLIPWVFVTERRKQLETVIDLLEYLINLPEAMHSHMRGIYSAFLHMLCILIDINLEVIGLSKEPGGAVLERILSLIPSLPINLSIFLFFKHLTLFIDQPNTYKITIMVGLIQRSKVPRMTFFALQKIETERVLAKFSLSSPSPISKLLSQGSMSVSTIPNNLLSFLYVHQRVIIGSISSETDDFSIVSEYTQILTNHFDVAAAASQNRAALEDTLVFALFSNFVKLIPSLSHNHSFAQLITALLPIMLSSLTNFVRAKQVNLNKITPLSEFILHLLFTFGSFSSSLVKGGVSSRIESNFYWLYIANIAILYDPILVDNLMNEDRTELMFINSDKIMQEIYRSYRAPLHKRLSKKIQDLDKSVLLALCIHLGKLEELHLLKIDELKDALREMLYIRNTCRQYLQEGNEQSFKWVLQRCALLHNMKSDFTNCDDPCKCLHDYILDTYPPESIKQQTNRIQTALVGFALIDQTYQMNLPLPFTQIVSYSLSNIDNFHGFASILSVTSPNTNQLVQMRQFFKRVLEVIASISDNNIILFLFRFFRDLNALEFIREEVLKGALELLNTDQTRYSLFALSLSLIGRTKCSIELLPDSRMGALLYSEGLKVSSFSHWTGVLTKREECRILYRQINSGNLLYLISQVNENMKTLNFIDSCEYIWVLRRVLEEGSPMRQDLIHILSSGQYQYATLSILGLSTEPVRPYCNISLSDGGRTLKDYMIVPEDNEKEYRCYSIPLSLSSPPKVIDISSQTLVYAIPILSLNPENPVYHEIIFSYVSKSDLTPELKLLLSQAIAHFSMSPTFSQKLKGTTMSLGNHVVPFSDIPSTLGKLERLNTQVSIIDSLDSFSKLSSDNCDFESYISDQIHSQAQSFIVELTFPVMHFFCYMGIVSDCLTLYDTRYSIIHVPTGQVYPEGDATGCIDLNTPLQLHVNAKERVVSLCNVKTFFPDGEKFRVFFAVQKGVNFNIRLKCSEDVFVKSAKPVTEFSPLSHSRYKQSLFPEPSWVMSYTGSLPSDISSLPSFPLTSLETFSQKDKIRKNYTPPPNRLLIHATQASSISYPLLECYRRGLVEYLSLQWETLALTRLSIHGFSIPDSSVVDLFTILAVQLEPFDLSLFQAGEFPFPFQNLVWQQQSINNALFLSLEVESKAALRNLLLVISEKFDFIDSFCRDPAVHLICRPHPTHMYLPSGEPSLRQPPIPPNSIVVVNSLQPPGRRPVDIPIPCLEIPQTLLYLDLSLLSVSPTDNSWVYGTPYLVILYLKYMARVQNVSSEKIKALLAHLLTANSPFTARYLSLLTDYVQLHHPPTPIIYPSDFSRSLLVLASTNPPQNSRCYLFYSSEQKTISSNLARTLFFLSTGNQFTNRSKSVFIPSVILDPGSLQPPYSPHILLAKLTLESRDSISGFPFWELFPYWIALTSPPMPVTPPTLTLLSDTVLRIHNPSLVLYELTFSVQSSPDAILLSDTSPLLDSAVVTPLESLQSSNPDLYLVLVGSTGGWPSARYNIRILESATVRKSSPVSLDNISSSSKIWTDFQRDSLVLALQWTVSHTSQLVSLIPRTALRDPSFATVEAVCTAASDSLGFSPTVCSLVGLLIHHFNFIRVHHRQEVPESLWSLTAKLVSREDAAEGLSASIITSSSYSRLLIDRHSAHRLILDGGSPSMSVINQFSAQVRVLGHHRFQCREKPWSVVFTGERAIDAGGPARELMTELAASAFEPSSDLMFPVEKGYFLPKEMTNERESGFYAVGLLIGVTIRTGFAQDLPLAPIVWKYIANEKITPEDVAEIDQGFDKTLRDCQAGNLTFWETRSWSGKGIILPGHEEGDRVPEDMKEQFISEAFSARVSEIEPSMREIRRGFRENVGFEEHPLLSGALISGMAQGVGNVSVEDLKSIALIQDFEGGEKNPVIIRFWRAIKRLSPEQCKLLLKFVTTLTRLPNPAINPGFKIRISRMEVDKPDDVLPTASTCSNKLHLPAYSTEDVAYQKIITAIQYCQTMENA